MKMRKNLILIALVSLVCLVMVSSSAYSATITTCTLDESYYPGQTGYVAVTVYNDEESKIRIPELTAAIDYYYNDDSVYVQTFYRYLDPPTEIQSGQSDIFYIQFNLPHNIAPGYTTLAVRAKTEIWNEHAQSWQWSDSPTYQPTLYIESPYKPQFEDTHTELQELQAINSATTNMTYLLGLTTTGLAVATIILILIRRSRTTNRPTL